MPRVWKEFQAQGKPDKVNESTCFQVFAHVIVRHMALHDPDSSAAEKAIALKIGRQKKIQIIDGQQVKLTTVEEQRLL